jgi:hypothetical protein
MNPVQIDIFNYDDYDDEDFQQAISDLKEFGVNEDEVNLNFINIE